MSSNGYHSLPANGSAATSTSKEQRQSLLMDSAAHDVPLDKSAHNPQHHKQLSDGQQLTTRFNHQASIGSDISAIRGTGLLSKLLPGPFWIKNIIGQPHSTLHRRWVAASMPILVYSLAALPLTNCAFSCVSLPVTEACERYAYYSLRAVLTLSQPY